MTLGVPPNGKRRKRLVNIPRLRCSHPNGIKPLANHFFGGEEHCNRSTSLGSFSRCPDELLLHIVGELPWQELLSLGCVSRLWYFWASLEELWRNHYVDRYSDRHFKWCGSWKRSFLRCNNEKNWSLGNSPNVALNGVYSDVLYAMHRNSEIDLTGFSSVSTNAIPKISAHELANFHEKYSSTRLPVIITGLLHDWTAMSQWTKESLIKNYGHVEFKAETLNMQLQEYFAYADSNTDEAPLYLFDQSFADKTALHRDYSVPSIFGGQDLFHILGPRRPDYRWLIIGGARSGSTFHIDPNGTSAWNAVIQGSKKWIMFPPSTVPPGVFISSDGGEVTAPLSVAEWLWSYYDKCRTIPGVLEGICKAGEVVFVPSGQLAILLRGFFSTSNNLYRLVSFGCQSRDVHCSNTELCGPVEPTKCHELFTR